jgi:hypothetical protein
MQRNSGARSPAGAQLLGHCDEVAQVPELKYAIYHDRYRRTADGWKFTERVYEVRYHDTTPLTGAPPEAAGPPHGGSASPE